MPLLGRSEIVCTKPTERVRRPAINNISSNRHGEGPGPYSITTLPFGLIPSAFSGDEHVSIGGVAQALLPPASPQLQQHHQTSSSDWGQFAESIFPAPWNNHWQGLWTAPFGSDAGPSPQAEPNTCQPRCTIHSEAYHSAALLLGKIIAFPANYVQQWRPEKTDEVLFWLNWQAAFMASPPGSTSGTMARSFQPTRQDAVLLRICKHEKLTEKKELLRSSG